MTLSLMNLIAYSAQIAIVVCVGGAVMTFAPIQSPRIRFALLWVLLALCMALPLIEPRAVVGGEIGVLVAILPLEFADTNASQALQVARPAAIPSAWIGVLLLAGMVFRLTRMSFGVVRLQRSARYGESLVEDAGLQIALGTSADIRYVEGIHHPVTYGVLAPMVLLPVALKGHPDNLRRAVLCHELLHVRRRDWVWLVVEEIIRSVLWFHPAVWWLVSQIQCAREELVDGLVVAHTAAVLR